MKKQLKAWIKGKTLEEWNSRTDEWDTVNYTVEAFLEEVFLDSTVRVKPNWYKLWKNGEILEYKYKEFWTNVVSTDDATMKLFLSDQVHTFRIRPNYYELYMVGKAIEVYHSGDWHLVRLSKRVLVKEYFAKPYQFRVKP